MGQIAFDIIAVLNKYADFIGPPSYIQKEEQAILSYII
jgi:hypothetical protein